MIELINVSAGYAGKDVIKDININFIKNKITGIIGPNGSGKTTLLKTACRLLKPGCGSILLEGKDIFKFTPKEIARKAAVLPQSRIAPNMSVESFIMHGRFPYANFSRKPSQEDRLKVLSAMEMTKTYEFRAKNITHLSGGERQRVYIAMAVAQDTEVILLDEPTTHLDICQQIEVLDLLRLLNGKGKTIIMIMHDISQAMKYCDYVCVMNKGRILCCLPPPEVYEGKFIEESFKIICRQNIINSDIIYTFSK